MSLKSKPSIDDVARLAGVSAATVSRSLNKQSQVKATTLEAVRKAIDELGYTPHFGGRALASNKTDTIGAIIPTMDNALFARGLQALQETLAQAGVTLLVATSCYDPAREANQIRALLSRGVDGLLLIGTDRPKSTYAMLKQHDVPVVTAWSFNEKSVYPKVGFDNFAAAEKLANCVLDFGHRNIAMIAGVAKGNDRAADRIRGVRKALKSANLTLKPSHLIEVPYNFESATAAMEKLMKLVPRPTAIICGNDVLGAGAMMFAKSIGISVPSDVSVVGFDNIDLAMVTDPPLTTVHVPHRRMGQAAAELLLALRSETEDVASVEIETELIIRESLGPPKV